MSQVPALYVPGSSFAALAELPILTNGLPGPQLDGEFTRLGASVNQTIGRLSELQQDDGGLRQNTVTLASLSPEVLNVIISTGITARTWRAGAEFSPGDLVSSPIPPDLIVSGTISPDFNGPLYEFGELDGKPAFSTNGEPTAPAAGRWVTVRWGSGLGAWVASVCIDGSIDPSGPWASTGDVATPDLAATWVAFGGSLTGAFAVTAPSGGVTLGTYLCIEAHTASNDFPSDAPKWALIAAPPLAGALVVDEFTGDGSQTAFVLSVDPLTKTNTQVYVDGFYIHKDAYSLSGTTILFGIAPLNGDLIEVVSGVPTASTVVTVSDGGITPEKLAAGAVTADKIAAGAVGPDALANLSVGTSKLATGAVTPEKIAAFGITADKIGPGAVTAGKLAPSAVASGNIAPNAVTPDKIPNSSITGAKLASGPLPLNGEPTADSHAATKLYTDGKAGEAAAAAVAPVAAAKANKAGDTFTGPIVLGTAPLEIPAGTAPIFGARAFAKITPYFGGGLTSAYKVGTFIRDGAGTITVTITAHGLRTGDAIFLDFASAATDGLFSVTKLTDNTFTVPQAGGVTGSLAVTARLFRIAAGKNISSVTTSDGGADHLVCNFTLPMPSADYTLQATVGYLASAGMSVANEDATIGTQINTAGQCFIFIHGNTSPRQVNVTVFA